MTFVATSAAQSLQAPNTPTQAPRSAPTTTNHRNHRTAWSVGCRWWLSPWWRFRSWISPTARRPRRSRGRTRGRTFWRCRRGRLSARIGHSPLLKGGRRAIWLAPDRPPKSIGFSIKPQGLLLLERISLSSPTMIPNTPRISNRN